MTMRIADRLVEICEDLSVPLVFKASFDKANRTSGSSFRGPGLVEGMKIFERVKAETGLPVTTDLHETGQAQAIGRGRRLDPDPRVSGAADRPARSGGGDRPAGQRQEGAVHGPVGHEQRRRQADGVGSVAGVLLTERGTTFGYGRLVNDFRAIPQMQATGAPVVFDATHSVQLPSAGAGGTVSSGQREMIPTLARAAVAAGCDALFLEVHPDPDRALSDGPNSLHINDLQDLLRLCLRIREAISTSGSKRRVMRRGIETTQREDRGVGRCADLADCRRRSGGAN